MKFGENPSFGSRDRVQTSFFWSKFDNSVLLWPWSQGHQSLIISFPLPKKCLWSLVKIHPLVQEIRVQTRSNMDADVDRIHTKSSMSPHLLLLGDIIMVLTINTKALVICAEWYEAFLGNDSLRNLHLLFHTPWYTLSSVGLWNLTKKYGISLKVTVQ